MTNSLPGALRVLARLRQCPAATRRGVPKDRRGKRRDPLSRRAALIFEHCLGHIASKQNYLIASRISGKSAPCSPIHPITRRGRNCGLFLIVVSKILNVSAHAPSTNDVDGRGLVMRSSVIGVALIALVAVIVSPVVVTDKAAAISLPRTMSDGRVCRMLLGAAHMHSGHSGRTKGLRLEGNGPTCCDYALEPLHGMGVWSRVG